MVVIQFLVEFIWAILFVIIGYPVVVCLATPFVLTSALFESTPYWTTVKAKYVRVVRWWHSWGIVVVPP